MALKDLTEGVPVPKGHIRTAINLNGDPTAGSVNVFLPKPKIGTYYRVKHRMYGHWFGPAKSREDAVQQFAAKQCPGVSKDELAVLSRECRIGQVEYTRQGEIAGAKTVAA